MSSPDWKVVFLVSMSRHVPFTFKGGGGCSIAVKWETACRCLDFFFFWGVLPFCSNLCCHLLEPSGTVPLTGGGEEPCHVVWNNFRFTQNKVKYMTGNIQPSDIHLSNCSHWVPLWLSEWDPKMLGKAMWSVKRPMWLWASSSLS